jgi:hypothetical protein
MLDNFIPSQTTLIEDYYAEKIFKISFVVKKKYGNKFGQIFFIFQENFSKT